MKKTLFCVLLLTLGINFNAKAHDFSVTNNGKIIYYNITSSTAPYTAEVTFQGTIYIEYNNEYSGAISIPISVSYNNVTYKVSSIGDNAFAECSELTSITVPNSVNSIGEGAFSDCSGLTSITIPNSVTSIGNSAFFDCTGLNSITIPNSVTSIGESAFATTPYYNNKPDGLIYINNVLYKYKGTMPANTTINIQNGTKSISNSAFMGYNNLTSITIPNSVTSIGSSSFSYCSNLTSITIPSSVTSIGRYAFSNCSNLTLISIPNSLTSIGENAFPKNSKLTIQKRVQ